MKTTNPTKGKPPKDVTDLRDKVGREKLVPVIMANTSPVDTATMRKSGTPGKTNVARKRVGMGGVPGADASGHANARAVSAAEPQSASNANGVCHSATGSLLALPPAEIVELVELARCAFADASASSTNSTNSAGGYAQEAIYPADSILADWMDFVREHEESAEVFLLGSILPVCGALLARRAWFTWGWRKKYANVFGIIVGKPGDRKSSVILAAADLARRVLPPGAFLPASFSPESLFDEYSEDDGGQPDKLWMVDDANGTLKDWQKSVNGERVATRFLQLFDCQGISESFRRNKGADGKGVAKRSIESTSTSLLFGATFNIAAFQGQEVRGGMARRFLYYVAERHGRLITRPQRRSRLGMDALAEGFKRLLELNGEMDFTPEANAAWDDFQEKNRAAMDKTDPLQEAKLSRLSSSPMQTLSMAMIFAACRWAKGAEPWTGLISSEILELAIRHVDACVGAANHLDAVANRAELVQDAEVLLARVRHDFRSAQGFHFATRTELTKRYASNPGRSGSWRPDDIYLRFIPMLEGRGEARLIRKAGKLEVYAFAAEPNTLAELRP